MTAIGRGSALVAFLAFSLLLSACVSAAQGTGPIDKPRPPSVSPDSAAADPSSTPSGTAVEVASIPIELDCRELLPAEALYEYNPNIGTSPSVILSPLTECVLGYEGLACGWSNQSSGERITAAVAHFATADLEAVRDSAEVGPEAQAVADLDGYFWRDADLGTLAAFSGEYWIVIESSTFVEVADARPLFDAIAGSLS